MILMISIFFLIWRWAVFGQISECAPRAGLGVGAVTYISFLFIMGFPISFRGDIDHLDFLKTLPIRPLALAAGELTGCAVVLTSVQLAVLAIYGGRDGVRRLSAARRGRPGPSLQRDLAGGEQPRVPDLPRPAHAGHVRRPEYGRPRHS